MTRFDTDLASRGWALISEGAQMISLAYAANEQPGTGGATPAAVSLPPQGSPVPADPPRLNPQVDAGLGICPVHGKAWTIKPAGTSRSGEPYEAFYKCSEKDGDNWCKQKPQKIWRDTHPIREGVAA